MTHKTHLSQWSQLKLTYLKDLKDSFDLFDMKPARCPPPPQKNLKNRTEAIPATRSTAEAASPRRQNPVPAPDKTTTFFQNLGGTLKKIFKFLEVPLTQSTKMRISLCKIGLSQNPNPLTLIIAHYPPKTKCR